MEEFDLIGPLAASIIPLIIGAIWYSPKVFGNAMAVENQRDPSMPKKHGVFVYIITVIASLLIAMLIMAILSTHAMEDRTVSHGMFHGAMASIFMGIPPFLVISLFEERSKKYIMIHALYWFVSFALMGAVVGYFL